MFRGIPKLRLLRQVTRLNQILGTPETAYKLPSDVSKVELVLLSKNVFGPSVGLKRFWRQNLPTLKFHNVGVDFVMTRVRVTNKADIAKVPTKIVLHTRTGEKTDLDCSAQSNEQILKNLVQLTKAEPVPPEEIPRLSMPRAQTI